MINILGRNPNICASLSSSIHIHFCFILVFPLSFLFLRYICSQKARAISTSERLLIMLLGVGDQPRQYLLASDGAVLDLKL